MVAKNIVVIDSDLKDIVPAFVEKRRVELTTIKEAIIKNDFTALASIGHKLKGNAGGYGLYQLSEYGARLETSAKQRDLNVLNEVFAEITSYLDGLEIQYKNMDYGSKQSK